MTHAASVGLPRRLPGTDACQILVLPSDLAWKAAQAIDSYDHSRFEDKTLVDSDLDAARRNVERLALPNSVLLV